MSVCVVLASRPGTSVVSSAVHLQTGLCAYQSELYWPFPSWISVHCFPPSSSSWTSSFLDQHHTRSCAPCRCSRLYGCPSARRPSRPCWDGRQFWLNGHLSKCLTLQGCFVLAHKGFVRVVGSISVPHLQPTWTLPCRDPKPKEQEVFHGSSERNPQKI